MKYTSSIATALLSVALVTNSAQAQKQNQYQYSSDWAKWAYAIPAAKNPIIDAAEAECSINQKGSLWFLGGKVFGNRAKRTCTLPENTQIVTLIIGSTTFNTPNICGQKGSKRYQDVVLENMKYLSGIKNIFVEVDGKRLDKDHIQHIYSRNFIMALPEDNIFDAPCAKLGNVPAGNYTPASQAGYYAFIDPLPVGKHTLLTHAISKGIVKEIIYDLTVVPVK